MSRRGWVRKGDVSPPAQGAGSKSINVPKKPPKQHFRRRNQILLMSLDILLLNLVFLAKYII